MFDHFPNSEKSLKLHCIEAGNKHLNHAVIFILIDLDVFFTRVKQVSMEHFRFILIYKYEILNQDNLAEDLAVEIKKMMTQLHLEKTYCVFHHGLDEKFKSSLYLMDLLEVITVYKKQEELYLGTFLSLNPVETKQKLDLVEEVGLCIEYFLSEGEPYLSKVAKKMSLKPRALSTKLGNESVDFRVLVKKKRVEEALFLLKNENIKLYEIAYKLGYTECSAFTRAFKNWIGCSPSQFRRYLNSID